MELSNTKWWTYQQFKSKVAGIPLSYEVMLRDNRLLKVTFFEGEAFYRNDFAGLFTTQWRSRTASFKVNLWDLNSLSEPAKAMIQRLCSVGVAVEVRETHDYYKLKNPAVIGYAEGPRFQAFANLFYEEVDKLLYEHEIIEQDEQV